MLINLKSRKYTCENCTDVPSDFQLEYGKEKVCSMERNTYDNILNDIQNSLHEVINGNSKVDNETLVYNIEVKFKEIHASVNGMQEKFRSYSNQ